MSDTKLSPKTACMHLDTLQLPQLLPNVNLYIEEEKRTQKSPITIFKPKVKSNSNELF